MVLNGKQDFVDNLKAHLFHRLRTGNNGDDSRKPTSKQIRSVRIFHDYIYKHKTMRINFDTYDMRRDQDSVNPDSHADVMMRAPADSKHPFLYARVLGIFHVQALLISPHAQHLRSPWQIIHVCFVRWFEVEVRGIRKRRLTPLRWANTKEEPFGFVSPDNILRGCHLIPAVPFGRSNKALPGISDVRYPQDEEDDLDWNRYYVNQYVSLWPRTQIPNA